MTWKQIIEAEPLLAHLERIVAGAAVPQTMPGYWRRWSAFKRVMEQLVGWDAINPALRNEAAYNAAHDHLLDIYERRAAEIAEGQA